jgi:hypothetical protein
MTADPMSYDQYKKRPQCDVYKKTITAWRQFAMASIAEGKDADHAPVIRSPMMQE